MSTISYFSHDSNARNSAKLIKLRMGLGLEGYAIYFMILERLREAKDYKSSTDYEMLGFDFRTDSEKVKKVVEDYGLFSLSEGHDFFWSKSFDERMTLKDEKNKRLSEAGKRGAEKRWQIKTDSHPTSQGIGANSKKRKVKKRKVKKSIYTHDSSSQVYDADDKNYKLAELLFDEIRTNDPKFKEPNLQKWANDIRLTHERDERDYDEIEKVIKWVQKDDFWKTNVLSPAKLRKRYSQLIMKIKDKPQQQAGQYDDFQRQLKKAGIDF